jgi:conjugal transfer pilus assembly protein TraL
MEQVKIPKRVDDAPNFLLWQVDELAPMIIGLLIGMFMDQALLMFLLGAMVTKYYRKFRDSKPDGHLYHTLYWYGVVPLKASCMKNPYIKRYFP